MILTVFKANLAIPYVTSFVVQQVTDLMLSDWLLVLAHHEADPREFLLVSHSPADPSNIVIVLLAQRQRRAHVSSLLLANYDIARDQG